MWRVLDTGCLSGAENLAWDEALLKARARGLIPDTLRYLRFSPPVALVGYHQSVEEEIRTDYCRRQGIEINRRITGGGAIYFDEGQLGWELIASRNSFKGVTGWEAINQAICEAAAQGLRSLGVEASFRPRNDLEVRGRKISGTGAALEGEALLFQGTLLVDFNLEHLIKALRIPTEKLQALELSAAGERVTSLKEQLGRLPALSEVRRALEQGFREKLEIEAIPGEILPVERELFEAALPERRSKDWILGRRVPFRPQRILRSIHKEKGGLIRVALKVDTKKEILREILITGDFFIHPRRAVYDLEAALKNAPIRDLPGIVKRYFSDTPLETLGLTWEDFWRAIQLALEKLIYPKFGFTLEEADHLTAFHRTLPEILSAVRPAPAPLLCQAAGMCLPLPGRVRPLRGLLDRRGLPSGRGTGPPGKNHPDL